MIRFLWLKEVAPLEIYRHLVGVQHARKFSGKKCQYDIKFSIRTGENFRPNSKLSEQGRLQRMKLCVIQKAQALSRPTWPSSRNLNVYCALGPTQPSNNGYRVFPEGKAAGAWRLPPTPSNAEVKERVELYLKSPSGPSWPVLRWTLLSPFCNALSTPHDQMDYKKSSAHYQRSLQMMAKLVYWAFCRSFYTLCWSMKSVCSAFSQSIQGGSIMRLSRKKQAKRAAQKISIGKTFKETPSLRKKAL
jgi:hypothetical protein